jgi:photosystem II stability/assembly factor-like uncharacterized protein
VYAAGNEGIILKSVDDGSTWMRIDPGSGIQLNGSAAKGNIFAVFAGDGGVVLATTNGGMSFTSQNTGTDRDLHGVFFFDDHTGFIGGKENVLLFTSNGGASWITRNTGLDVNPDEAEINGIYFVNSMTGWVAGKHGEIFMTTNAGMMWNQENSQTTEDLNDIFFIDENHGWAVGHNGTIRFRGIPNGVDPHQNAVNSFRLEQNYPNPFNPATKIRFELPVSAIVNLTVYDMNGRAVTVLADGLLRAGSHDILFDGSSLASGVYFYILKTSSFKETKRMVLVK